MAHTKPHLLVVSPTFPYPLVSGGKIRIYNMLKQLSLFFEITLISLAEEGDGLSETNGSLAFVKHVYLVPIRQDKRSQLLRLVKHSGKWFKGVPAEILVKYSEQMQTQVARFLATGKFNIVMVEYIQGMQYLPKQVDKRIAVILVAHDISFISQQRKAEIARGFMKIFWALEAKWMKKYECAVWRQCDCIHAMSAVDRKHILDQNSDLHVEVIPNGVDIGQYTVGEEGEKQVIVFVGWMRHLPNRDALSWFIDEIWPLITLKNDQVILQIIGGGVPGRIAQQVKDDVRVEFLGFVEDIQGIMSCATMSVVPIRIGSGSRLKILESMVFGTPVISTTIGCEGLLVDDGVNIIISDSAATFADAVLDLIENIEQRKILARNARKLVEQFYSWDEIGKKAAENIVNLTEKHGVIKS